MLKRFRDRKVGQWALAYLAGAWLALQLVDVLGARWGVSDRVGRVLDILLAGGFVVTIVLAWYHGERGRQRVSALELLLVCGVLGLAGFGLRFAMRLDTVASGGLGEGDYYWGGAASTIFWVDPVEDLSVVFMTQLMPSATFNFRGQLKNIIYAAID